MAEKLALKRLAGSDLSFFDFHFRNKTYGDHRQKGINLNTDVFVDQFYPQAHALMGARWPVLTTLYGPGTAPAFVPPGNPQRPITYNNAKNWRLNGGTIPDDPALPDRWQPLAPGDLALFRFRGDPAPDEVDVILIAQGLLSHIHTTLMVWAAIGWPLVSAPSGILIAYERGDGYVAYKEKPKSSVQFQK